MPYPFLFLAYNVKRLLTAFALGFFVDANSFKLTKVYRQDLSERLSGQNL